MAGNWQRDPSGLTRGDLNGWRKKMYDLCPNPDMGTIVVTTNKEDKQVGYECIKARGFDSSWARVSREKVDGMIGLYDEGIHMGNLVIDSTVRRSMEEQADDYTGSAGVDPQMGIYLCDGVYIDPDDCWF